MKIGSALFFILSVFAIAGEKYGVYDLQGNRVSTFEAELYELPEKARQFKATYPNRNLYFSSMSKGKASKPSSRYRYKAETGAYIEVSRKETFSICPDKETQGVWISEHSVASNTENCLSVQASNLAGTFRILFLGNSGRMDTIQVLVEQSYIQMGDYSHRIWVPDSMPARCRTLGCDFPAYGHYESRSYSKYIIVDKTKLTIEDAQHYSEIGNIDLMDIEFLKEFAKSEKLNAAKLPYSGKSFEAQRLANMRSKNEGLDTVYHIVDMPSHKSKNANLIILNPNGPSPFIAIDTSASGYRVPYDDEWLFLMRAGASTLYYWGNEEDSLAVSRYAWVRPIGLKPVAQLLPNKFGLYDMIGNADEWVETSTHYIYSDVDKFFYNKYLFHELGRSCATFYDSRAFSPECDFAMKSGTFMRFTPLKKTHRTCISESGKAEKCPSGVRAKKIKSPDTQVSGRAFFTGIRLVREISKLHKLEKF